MTDFSDLISGYYRFQRDGWTTQRDRWAELAEGQSPDIMVIACSDSRVDPSTIFDSSPGQMFVVRNVANLVPPYELGGGRHGVSAALEFAVTQLEVSEILVMGHGACGGCAAALSQNFKNAKPGEGGFISRWIEMLDDARETVIHTHGEGLTRDAIRAMEHEAIKVSIANLRTFACISEREAAGAIRLHGAWFSIDGGELFVLDEASGEFRAA
jgi:carbonic anhydrase